MVTWKPLMLKQMCDYVCVLLFQMAQMLSGMGGPGSMGKIVSILLFVLAFVIRKR